MNSDGRRRQALRGRLVGWSRRASRPLDRKIHQYILELMPAEDGIPIPGVLGFIGCYFRQLVQVRPPVAARVATVEAGRRRRALRGRL